MPGPCALCGGNEGIRRADGWRCAVCGWRVGDAPDPELPRRRVDVVYYLRWDDRVKIGTTSDPRRRLQAIWHQELLAFEPGGRTVEQRRHRQFAAFREGGEWFRYSPELHAHVTAVRGGLDPWRRYATWLSEALRP